MTRNSLRMTLVLISAMSGVTDLPSLSADVFYVNLRGEDSPERDGRKPDSAWRSLAHACSRVPEGEHVIQLGQGVFEATQTAHLKSGWTVRGVGRKKQRFTEIRARRDWALSEAPCEGDVDNEFLLVGKKVRGVTILDLILSSDPEHRITGGLRLKGARDVAIRNVGVREFRWTGLELDHCASVEVSGCRIENASTEKCRFHNGLIKTRWLKHSEIHHNEIVSDVGGGYGYKGGGHEGVRIHHNYIDVVGGFSIESAHENEYGVEIDHNHATRCISIPKGGQGADPKDRGFAYSFWIHDNYLTDSYTVEGPRNHLRLSHNYIHIQKPNGRVYTHHGGKNHGPIWIHHNVVENVDRGFVWMNRGLAQNIHVHHNTVFLADAGDRSGSVFGAYSGERLDGWVVHNNIFVAAWSRPRKLFPTSRGVPEKIEATHNICVNLTDVPPGNFVDRWPELKREGAKPWPFYAPVSGESWPAGIGKVLELWPDRKSPTPGALEPGERRPLVEIPRRK